MKLVEFKRYGTGRVAINPDRVTKVYETSYPNRTCVYTADGGMDVQEDYETVVRKLRFE